MFSVGDHLLDDAKLQSDPKPDTQGNDMETVNNPDGVCQAESFELGDFDFDFLEKK